MRKLEYFFAFLIAVMMVCFYIEFGKASPSAGDIFDGFAPVVSDYAAVQAVGILGAVIMPHNIYLHSALVQSRSIDRSNPRKVAEANKYFAIESGFALAISFFINLAVLCVFAIGFFSKNCAEKDSFQVDVRLVHVLPHSQECGPREFRWAALCTSLGQLPRRPLKI